MIKKISYILILFISLFVVSGVVKADFKCSYSHGTYTFHDDGTIASFYSESAEWCPSCSTGGSSGRGSTKSYGAYDSTEHEIFLVSGGSDLNKIQPNMCPDEEDIVYVINNETYDCWVTVQREYYCKHKLIKCSDIVFNGCSEYTNYNDCTTNPDFSCVWVDRDSGKIINDSTVSRTDAYCNVDNLQYVQCGDSFDIPTYVPKITSFVINLLKILTPIILVFTSAITLLKAITANKEDEMNKAKTTLVRRIGIAALIFFTITITQFVINKVAEPEEADELGRCFNCFINGINKCEGNTYYKNNINGEYQCFYTNDINRTEPFKGECH